MPQAGDGGLRQEGCQQVAGLAAVLWPLQSLPLKRLPQNLFLNRWGVPCRRRVL